MAKLKPIAFTVGIMLLIGAALCLYFSLRNLSSIRPASAYEDMGVHILCRRKFILYRGRTTLPGGRSATIPLRLSTSCAIGRRTGAAISTSTSLALWKAPHRVFWKRASRQNAVFCPSLMRTATLPSAQTKPRRHTKLGRSAPTGRLPECLRPICWYGLRSMGFCSINGAKECKPIQLLVGNEKGDPPQSGRINEATNRNLKETL